MGQQSHADGPVPEAVTAFETIINRRGASLAAFAGAAGAALMAGDPEKAERFCQLGLRSSLFDQTCLALLGTAWRMRGDERDEELNGYDRFIRVFDLKPPEGFSSMESFNAELGAYLERLHPKTDAYLEQSLHGGSQTEGMLFGAGHGLVETLRARIEEAIITYVSDLAPNGQHPFLVRHSKKFYYTGAWSCLMRGQGFHTNHLHPDGWISSAYYVTVPEEADDPAARNGWIKFGEPFAGSAAEGPDPPCRSAGAGQACAVSILYMARHRAASRGSLPAPPSPSTPSRNSASNRKTAAAFRRLHPALPASNQNSWIFCRCHFCLVIRSASGTTGTT